MKKDSAIAEVRDIRHRISARYGHDTRALLTHYKELQKRFADRMLKEPHVVACEKAPL
jgi:hypothetical protein